MEGSFHGSFHGSSSSSSSGGGFNSDRNRMDVRLQFWNAAMYRHPEPAMSPRGEPAMSPHQQPTMPQHQQPGMSLHRKPVHSDAAQGTIARQCKGDATCPGAFPGVRTSSAPATLDAIRPCNELDSSSRVFDRLVSATSCSRQDDVSMTSTGDDKEACPLTSDTATLAQPGIPVGSCAEEGRRKLPGPEQSPLRAPLERAPFHSAPDLIVKPRSARHEHASTSMGGRTSTSTSTSTSMPELTNTMTGAAHHCTSGARRSSSLGGLMPISKKSSMTLKRSGMKRSFASLGELRFSGEGAMGGRVESSHGSELLTGAPSDSEGSEAKLRVFSWAAGERLAKRPKH